MKKSILIAYILFMIFIIMTKETYANRAAGGELMYEWIGDSTYRFFFKYYNYCGGDPTDTSYTLCLYNTCADTSYSITLIKWSGSLPGGSPNGNPVPMNCLIKTNCDSPASTIPGYKEYWYTSIVTLPARCSLWRFSTTVSTRTTNDNLTPATGKNNLYLEATLNNLFFQGNSSPYFTIRPLIYSCLNSPTIFNNGAVDPNGDSLVTEIVHPKTRAGSCSDTAENIPFATGLSLPNDLFSTKTGVIVNARNGQVTFQPDLVGRNVLSMRVKEYRNGILVGTVTREIQQQTFNCPADTSKLTLLLDTVIGGNYYIDQYGQVSIGACQNQQLTFCWHIKSSDTNAKVVLNDNHIYRPEMQNATTTYSNPGTDSVHACFTWTPHITQLSGLLINIKDSSCRGYGISSTYQYNFPIYTWGAFT